MTERLYLADPYDSTFSARIIERHHLPPDARRAIVLDRSVFCPALEGVAADRGTLNDIPVTDVFEDEKGRLLHIIAQEIWKDEVQGRLDWPCRFELMQHHTAQHVLSGAFAQLYGAETVSATITPQAAWIELNKILPDDDVEQVANWAGQFVAAGHPVREALVDRARLGAVADADDGPKVRVVSVEGLPYSICQAMHVSRTTEIGLLRILRVDRAAGRIKNWMRVDFQCGARMLSALHQRDQIVTHLTAELGVEQAKLEETVVNLQNQASQAITIITTLHNQVLEYEAAALEAKAERSGDIRIVNRVFQDRDVAEIKQVAHLLVERPNMVVLMGVVGMRAQLFFARSADVSYDMSALIKAAAQAIDTQGGGQAHWAETMPVRADTGRVEGALSKVHKLLKAKR